VVTTSAPTLHARTRRGEEVLLRAHREDDVPALVEMLSDPECARWLSGPPMPYTREHAREFVASRPDAWAGGPGERTLVIEVGGRACGQVGLRPSGNGSASVGYVLGSSARGRGVMAATLRRFAAWALRPESDAEGGYGLSVLHWMALVGNWPSRRVAWACGFQVEGHVRGLLTHRGDLVDGWIGSLRRGDDLRPVHPWLEPERIELGDLLLRGHVPEDAERIMQACAHPSTQRWLPDLPDPYSLDDATAYIDSREDEHAQAGGVYWAVADADDNRLLGEIGLMGLGHGLSRSGEIGYWVHPDARRRGVATRALRAVARHGLLPLEEGGLSLERIVVRVAAPNRPSHGVARAAGFTEVGRDRRAERLRDGRREDLVRYDFLAEELEIAWAHPSSLR
jgi:RimJ/RimL family protein N-acetyltransferase